MNNYLKSIAAAAALFASAVWGPASAQTVPVNGQITKIDASAEKITIKHERIPNLDMDSMTMVFRVKDPAMLNAVKVGEAVVFEADRVNGAITVTSIRPQK